MAREGGQALADLFVQELGGFGLERKSMAEHHVKDHSERPHVRAPPVVRALPVEVDNFGSYLANAATGIPGSKPELPTSRRGRTPNTCESGWFGLCVLGT